MRWLRKLLGSDGARSSDAIGAGNLQAQQVEQEGVVPPVKLTPKAAASVRQMAAANAFSGMYWLRVGVKRLPDGAFSYVLDLTENVNPQRDVVYYSNDIRVVIDTDHIKYLDGTTIDYKDDPSGRGFHFDNPMAEKVSP